MKDKNGQGPKDNKTRIMINDLVHDAWKSAENKIKEMESTIKREQMKIQKPVKIYDNKTMKYTTKWVEDANLYGTTAFDQNDSFR